MDNIIIINRKKGNGLIGLSHKKKEYKLYAGHNELPVEVWESLRKLAVVQYYIRKRVLEEVNVKEIKEPTTQELSKYLSLDEFCDAIAPGELGIKPEAGGHYLVTLSEDVQKVAGNLRVFRVKASDEDVRLKAYAAYMKSMGGRPNVKISIKKLESLDAEQVEEIIKDTFNPDTLKSWKKNLKKDSYKALVFEQEKAINDYKGPKSDLDD